ncbi:hypothetical protein F4678DRAFT_463469 [Xylaria arbuscula]|nr:hypothetical protein F4678DRAFT_463469 [Xylaria arbuscula]
MSASKALTAARTEGSTDTSPIRPLETTSSYFPKGATASTLASTSSTTSATGTPLTSDFPGFNNPLSPLDREFSGPVQDIDIAEQLAKQPTYWSVNGWLQRSASSDVQPAREDPAVKTRKFEEAKKDLLASVGRF